MKKLLFLLVCSLALAFPVHAQNNNSVSLLWEADSYLPIFFAGHSQPAVGSTVKVFALTDTKNPVFNWSKDGRDTASASGTGKNILTFTVGPSDKAIDVRVQVKLKDGQVVGDKTITINIKDPSLVLYEDEPLTGTSYHQAITGTYNLTKPEVTMLVEPYYFSRTAAASNQISYSWLLNGKNIISNPSNPRQITFAIPESSGTGENSVELTAENNDNTFQTAKNNLLIKFGFKNASF